MTDLVAIDPETGERHACGTIAKKRTIGDTIVWLTYDGPGRMWWIVMQDETLRKIGFIEARREACWETFLGMTEADVAKLRSSVVKLRLS
jgi:hypothetical protein